MEDLWTKRPPPQPLDLDAILASTNAGAARCSAAPALDTSGSACKVLDLNNAHAVWAVEDSALVFLQAIELFLDSRADELGSAQAGFLALHVPEQCLTDGGNMLSALC